MAANPLKIRIPQHPPGGFSGAGQCWTPERSIFRQDKSSGPRGPNAVPKALDRRQWRHVHQQKPASDSLNPQNLLLIPQGSLLFAPIAAASGPQQCLTAFSH
jgi:hypothetical protein